MKKIALLSSCFLLFSLLFITACTNNDPAPAVLSAITFKDLNADYAPLVFSSDPAVPPTRPAQKRKFTFFSFKTGQVMTIADSSKSTLWDIGFRSTSIIVNGGTSGPGVGGVIVQQGIFADIKTAPLTGYVQDNYNPITKSGTFAISSSPLATGVTATNQWWYNSGTNQSTIVSPIAGQVFIIKTADGRYAKMEITSYYKGAPVTVNNLSDLDRYYTFRYVYQPGNSASF